MASTAIKDDIVFCVLEWRHCWQSSKWIAIRSCISVVERVSQLSSWLNISLRCEYINLFSSLWRHSSLLRQVLGQDFCARFINLCQRLQRDGSFTIDVFEGLKRSRKQVSLPPDVMRDNILFKQVRVAGSHCESSSLANSRLLVAHVALQRDRLLRCHPQHLLRPRHEPGSLAASPAGSRQRWRPLRRRVEPVQWRARSGGGAEEEVGVSLFSFLIFTLFYSLFSSS